MIDVGDEARPNRLPPEQGPGPFAPGRAVDGREPGEPAEMLRRLLGRLRDDRNVQAPTDRLGDIFDGTPSSATEWKGPPSAPRSMASL